MKRISCTVIFLRRMLPLAGLLASAACSSTATEASRVHLPFHVAVMPIEIVAKTGAPRAETDREAEASDVLDVNLELDEAAVSAAFVEALGSECFVRASLLDYPEGETPKSFRSLPDADQVKHWVQAGREAGADLLLRGSLTHHQLVRTDINDAFWLNLPLFLLGGPMTYFVDDRSYFLEARFRSSVYDLPALERDLEAGSVTLTPGRRLQDVRPDMREATLDFIDRADGVGDYALSILVPSGLLATETEDVEAELERQIVIALADDLVREIAAGSEQLLNADLLVQFVLRPEDLRLEPGAAGDGHVLTGVVLLQELEGGAPSMSKCRLSWAGGSRLEKSFDEPTRVEGDTGNETFLRYSFSFPLPSVLPEVLRLEVEDNSGSRRRRSYHLATSELRVEAATGG
jgi:hypothetical protein